MSQNKIRTYRYVGIESIAIASVNCPVGNKIESIRDIQNWIDTTKQKTDSSGLIPATFIVDLQGFLKIADRHSEHIACAGSEDVFSAGEIFFNCDRNSIKVVEISDRSTGYC